MMTDVTGSMFISYRRAPGRPTGVEEATLVCDALRDRGVPTWRDVQDLGPAPTEEELERTLKDDGIAGAIMLVSPEVEGSTIIRAIEAPLIMSRYLRGDGFLLHIALINVPYEDVDRVLRRPGALQEMRHFNMNRVANDPLDVDDARDIAKAVLKQRLGAIRQEGLGSPFTIRVDSRGAGSTRGDALCHDFRPYFDEKEAAPGAYQSIEIALLDAATALAATRKETDVAGGRRTAVSACGYAALPLGVLLGAVYSRFIFDLSWIQPAPDGCVEEWSLKAGVEDIATRVEERRNDPNSEDLVLAVSISADIRRAVSEYLTHEGWSPRATVWLGLSSGSLQQGQAITAQQGLKIAREAIGAVRDLKDKLGLPRARLHLFLACPLGLAVLIGQHLNTFGECVGYEHFPDRVPCYSAVHRFKPSNFTYHDQ